jgi:hypothetical protein
MNADIYIYQILFIMLSGVLLRVCVYIYILYYFSTEYLMI